jgi:hypothetical protein
MEKGILYATTRPTSPHREDEYHRWYDEQHLGDIIACDGFRLARRYEPIEIPATGELGASGDGPPSEREFVAVYDLEAEDLGAAVASMLEQIESGAIALSDDLATDPPPKLVLLRELSEARG